jgi:phosphoglycerol transferase MdoB-like AlkP superfamily enzyme
MIPTARSVVTSDANAVFAASSLRRDVYAETGVLPYHSLDVIAHLAPDRANTSTAGRARVITHLVRRRAERAQRSPLFGAARDRNLILVLAESLQGFPVDLTIRGQRITPNLAELARESMYFVNFYEQTHLGTTADGEFITMQSLHAAPVGVVATVHNTNRFRALPHVLSREGYSTFSAVGEPGDFWDMDRMHPALGFGRSYFANDYSATERIGDWIADREFLEESIPRLANQSQPFMAYLLTSSNHRPWNLPAKYRMLDLGRTEPDELENYLQSVHYFDWALGRFVDQLRHDGLLDRSVLVVLGDHQAFLERSDLAALLGSAAQHRDDYLVARKRVPLLIRLPHGAAAGIRTEVSGQIDIAPTLLTLLGVEDLESVMLGSDLTFGGDSLVVFRDGSFINGRHYAVNRFGPIENSTCYEWLSGRRVNCTTMTDQRQLAREQLEISDAILRFNLVPSVALHPSIRER